MRLRYAMHWLRFKAVQFFRPYRANWPSASSTRLGLEWYRWGFILWLPGQPLKQCGRRIHFLWRNWAQGPCNYATFAMLHSRAKAAAREVV